MLDDVTETPAQRGDLDERYAAIVESLAEAWAREYGDTCFDSHRVDTEARLARRQEIRNGERRLLDATNVRGLLAELDEMCDLHEAASNLAANAEHLLHGARAAVQRVRDLADSMERESPTGVGMHLARQLRMTLDGAEG